ncbi:MAG: hypothetical protein Q9227_001152 [Pyrenula ochraceoflavens]
MLDQSKLSPASRTLSPLPKTLHQGLLAVAVFGHLSFFTTLALFCYLTYKLVKWRIRGQANRGYNQFVLLIYNLVLADIQQSIAFMLTSRWLVEDKIEVGSQTCWAEGWFVSTGDLASGTWIFAIAVHTFFALVKGYKLPYRLFVATIFALWVFIFGMAIIGVVLHPGDFYVRAGAWCWINEKYERERLWLHYFWIFIDMFGTIIIYSIIFIVLRRRIRNANQPQLSDCELRRVQSGTTDSATTARAAKYMIIYPLIYVTCTLPLAAGRMAAMTDRKIPFAYYCLAGAFITSCGWLDVLLYACTRRILIFRADPPSMNDMGLDTFGLWDSSNKYFGTTTLIEGGMLNDRKKKPLGHSTPDGPRRVSSRSGSMDDLFGVQVPGYVHTKTTVQVSHAAMHPDGDLEIGMRNLSRDMSRDKRSAKSTEGDFASWSDGEGKGRFN